MDLFNEYYEVLLKWLYQPRNQMLLAAIAAGIAIAEKFFAPFRGRLTSSYHARRRSRIGPHST